MVYIYNRNRHEPAPKTAEQIRQEATELYGYTPEECERRLQEATAERFPRRRR